LEYIIIGLNFYSLEEILSAHQKKSLTPKKKRDSTKKLILERIRQLSITMAKNDSSKALMLNSQKTLFF